MNIFGKALGLTFLILACLTPALQGAYLNKMPVQVTQPDGRVLELFASGDEYHNWLHDADNYTIIADASGWYCYAEQSGEGVSAGPLRVGKDLPQSRGLTPGINISEASYKQLRQSRFYMPAERDAPTTGTINNLVVFIRFSDEAEFTDQISQYTGWFNTGTSSVKNYFLESSYNQLTVNTTFYPTTGTNYVVSWQDSHPRAYFQPYDAVTNPTGYNGDTESRLREFTLLQNATNGVSSQIPSNLTIDSDGDGKVDNVVYIIKGAAGAWSSLLWPHRWSLYDRYVYINGKRVYDFNLQLETFLDSRGVGVLCHEFFHTLGAPDLYHYTSNGISPAGSWDLMQSDQNPPQHMTAFMKWKYGDWITSIPTISADGVYTLNPLTSPTGNVYRINSNNANQYYMVEFRKDTGTFESSVPGSGMLIYRIDTSCGNGNADGPPDELYIYRPNGTTTADGSVSSANYSAETGRVRINSTTNPTPFLQDGTAGNLYLCEIGSSAGSTMTFRKGLPFYDFAVNPHIQSFDATFFPPDGWTNQAVSGTYTFTRVTSGTNPTCSPQSGAGMLRYNSDIAPAGNTAILVTPRIAVSNASGYGYQVSFWMYRDGNMSTALDKIEVYLNTSANLSGSPTLLGTVHRARQQQPVVSAPGWYQYSFALPFSAAGDYYPIFQAVSAAGYNIFLDNIRIAQVPFAAINPAPANLAARVAFTPQFTWQSGGGSPTGYKLYLGTNNPPSNLLNGTDLGNVLAYTHSASLLSNTTYYWKIVPYGLGGSANDCPVWSFTTMMNSDLRAVSLQGPGYSLPGAPLTYQFTVQNNGAQTQSFYLLKLMAAGGSSELASLQIDSPLAMDATAVHTLSWTPSIEGVYGVYGEVLLAGDQDPANNPTANLDVHIYPVTVFIPVVGNQATGSTANTLPLNFYWKNSVSETIYLASDLQMSAGRIDGIIYVNNFTQDLGPKPVKLWLKNTPEANLSAGWLPFDGYTLVFDGWVDFPAGVNEIFIPLDLPYIYNGGNLALRANRPLDSVYFLNTNTFYYNTATANPSRSRYLYSDSTQYDPTAPSSAGTLSSNIPLTMFIANLAAPLALPAPEVTAELIGESLELSWSLHSGYYGYDIYESEDPFSWPGTPVATVYTPSYTATDAARKFFRVVAFSYDWAPGKLGSCFHRAGQAALLQNKIPAGEQVNKD